jgi:sensor c-di-GMP phosphodiesterase-like protein
MRRAVVDLAPLLSELPGFHVNVNISVRDLRSPSFFAILDDICAEAGLPASSIAFEVTGHATADRDATVSGLRLLRDRGHRIYLDDFGTGYSSLSYLGDLPVDALKIDRGFTETFDHDSSKSAVLVQILELARQLDLDVVAEGVETERQAQWFQDRGVTRAQGWLFGRPMSAETFRGFASPEPTL